MWQRSRKKWLKDGERTTNFYYVVVRRRQARNTIAQLLNAQWEEIRGQKLVEEEAPNFFTCLYNKDDRDGVFKEFEWIVRVSDDQNRLLCGIPIGQEVKDDVLSIRVKNHQDHIVSMLLFIGKHGTSSGKI